MHPDAIEEQELVDELEPVTEDLPRCFRLGEEPQPNGNRTVAAIRPRLRFRACILRPLPDEHGQDVVRRRMAFLGPEPQISRRIDAIRQLEHHARQLASGQLETLPAALRMRWIDEQVVRLARARYASLQVLDLLAERVIVILRKPE